MNFGEFVFEMRKRNELGLREFCKQYGHDPSTWSKMERGFLPAPKNPDRLREYAEQLRIEYGSDEWTEFMDLADVSRGDIPRDILDDEELVDALPLFFRTVRGDKPTREELEKIVESFRRE